MKLERQRYPFDSEQEVAETMSSVEMNPLEWVVGCVVSADHAIGSSTLLHRGGR